MTKEPQIHTEVLVCAFNSEGFVLTVNKSNSLELPRGGILQGETQRQAAVRTLKDQTGFDAQPEDMFALYYDKLRGDPSSLCVLGYLCTKVLSSYWVWMHFGETTCEFQGTQKFLSNCSYQNYHDTILYHASTVSEQMKLPWSTQAKKVPTVVLESNPENQPKKDLEMKTNAKTSDNKPEITLELNGAYLTREGKEVKISEDNYCDKDYPFIGSNGYYYSRDGRVFSYKESEPDITGKVSPCSVPTQAPYCLFSTSELQSLITLNSKAIRSLEQEITELKELTKDLGLIVHHHWKVIDLRKSLYNQLSSKQKRLSKLVGLQQKMKRVK